LWLISRRAKKINRPEEGRRGVRKHYEEGRKKKIKTNFSRLFDYKRMLLGRELEEVVPKGLEVLGVEEKHKEKAECP